MTQTLRTHRTAKTCRRCGITHYPHITGERADYCTDCRPHAIQAGWCPPNPSRRR